MADLESHPNLRLDRPAVELLVQFLDHLLSHVAPSDINMFPDARIENLVAAIRGYLQETQAMVSSPVPVPVSAIESEVT
jgi:hypothetical protein